MIRRTFNLFASIAGFAIGSIYLFSDGASVTANVIGSSGSIAGFAAVIGMVMIVSAIGLFIVTLHHVDNKEIDLEKLVKRTNTSPAPQETAKETLSEPIVPVNAVKEEKTHKHAKK